MIYSLLFFVIFSVASVSASDLHNSLDKLCQAIPQGSIMKAAFTQRKTLSGLAKPIISTGEMILWQGKGIFWMTKTPFPISLLLTKEGIFRIENGKKQSLMKGQSQDQFVLHFLTKILTGQFSQITEFDVTVISVPDRNGFWKIRLIPLGVMTKFMTSIEIEGSKFIHHIVIQRINGDRDDISLQDYQRQTDLPGPLKGLLHE